MKAMLTSLEAIILFINFYFIIKIRHEVIKLDEACFGMYLLVMLQKSSKTLSEAIRSFNDFEIACSNISEFLNLSEIDFDTIDICDRNTKAQADGIIQSTLWEETSVKLGNDYAFGNNDDDAGPSQLPGCFPQEEFGKQFKPLNKEALNQKDFDEDQLYLGDGKSVIIIEKASFSWGLPLKDDLISLGIENEILTKESKFKRENTSRILSVLDKYEDIERSVDYSENSEYSLNILNFNKNEKKSIYKPFKDYISLKDINLRISKSELVCITGESGSGKTTLLQSILGETLFIDHETYEIFESTKVNPHSLVDINNYMEENQELVHLNPPVRIFGNIGLLQGDLWIREGTIRSNIILDHTFDKPKYDQIVVQLNLEAIFLKFEDEDLSEALRDLNFSEKFMINLARALYRNTSIILIEDILWKLDDYWKLLFFKSIMIEEYSKVTWIVVTHDPKILSKASKIIFMKNSKIHQVGSINDLKRKRCYTELIQLIEAENKHSNISMMSPPRNSKEKDSLFGDSIKEKLKEEHPFEDLEIFDHISSLRYFFMTKKLGLLFVLFTTLLIIGSLATLFSKYALFRWIEYTLLHEKDYFGISFIICFTCTILAVNIISIVLLQVFSYNMVLYLYENILDKVI